MSAVRRATGAVYVTECSLGAAYNIDVHSNTLIIKLSDATICIAL